MKYLIAVEITEIIEEEGESAEAVIESIRKKLAPQKALSATFKVIQESDYSEEEDLYKPI